MAKSKSKKLREKMAREKGYDMHALRRGTQFIQIDTTTKRTPTKQEKIRKNEKRQKQKGYHNLSASFQQMI